MDSFSWEAFWNLFLFYILSITGPGWYHPGSRTLRWLPPRRKRKKMKGRADELRPPTGWWLHTYGTVYHKVKLCKSESVDLLGILKSKMNLFLWGGAVLKSLFPGEGLLKFILFFCAFKYDANRILKIQHCQGPCTVGSICYWYVCPYIPPDWWDWFPLPGTPSRFLRLIPIARYP